VWVHRTTWLGGQRGAPARVLDESARGSKIASSIWLEPGDWITIERSAPAAASAPRDRRRKVPARVVRRLDAATRGDDDVVLGVELAAGGLDRARFVANGLIPHFALFLMLVTLANVAYLKERNLLYFWYHPVVNLYGLLVTSYIISRVLLACFYRPPRDTGHRPSVSVIVTCKNEEASIFRTIEHIVRSDYPRHLLEVIAVDDGSTDATLSEMERARREFPSLRIIHFPKNRGKRHGMAAGARKAHGDVLVFVDSDSFVRRDAVRKLASSFADPMVGAVCGHAYVSNVRTNALTRMQEVRYFVAFRVLKAAESLFSAVTCCSGCLAAYRKSYLAEFLDWWEQQRFLNVKTTFGDDRSLTNLMLRRHRVIYHSEAVCTTIVPDTWRVFYRQQLRWKKSWIRESLIASTFMWRRHPIAAASFYFGLLFPLVAPIVVFQALVLPWFTGEPFSMVYVYGATLMAALYGLIYLARHRNGLWIHGLSFSFVYMTTLVWQTYYALATLRRNQWGTR
jgi:hyaluronan synthase